MARLVRGAKPEESPKTESQGPDQPEVLGGIAPISIRSELIVRALVIKGLHQPQQFVGRASALERPLERQKRPIDRNQPQQPLQPLRQQQTPPPVRPPAIIWCWPRPAPHYPVPRAPEDRRQRQASPKRPPGTRRIIAVRQPSQTIVIVETALRRPVSRPCIHGAGEAVTQHQDRQARQQVQWPASAFGAAFARGRRHGNLPPRSPAHGPFRRQQPAEQAAGDIHDPNGPRLCGPKSPRGENHREIEQPLAGRIEPLMQKRFVGPSRRRVQGPLRVRGFQARIVHRE